MLYQIGLWFYGSRQYANGSRGGGRVLARIQKLPAQTIAQSCNNAMNIIIDQRYWTITLNGTFFTPHTMVTSMNLKVRNVNLMDNIHYLLDNR